MSVKSPLPPSPSPQLPFVSICTPTFNRRPFIPVMFECFHHQTYPKDRIEWIIVDDGTDKIEDLIVNSKIKQIKYYKKKEIMPLGKKRNYMHSLARGDILVYIDDDDYYPPERIQHAVEMLQRNPSALCAGSSIVFLYFKHIQKMVQFGPYGERHATAGTFAFRKELLNITKYEDDAYLAEERFFLKDYTIPFVQLDPMKTILVFSHIHNTFDKKRLIHNENKNMKYSDVTVDDFIRSESIKRFFMQDIDDLLANYEEGEPKMKPDLLKKMRELEQERERMMNDMARQQMTPIHAVTGNGDRIQLTMDQVITKMQEMEAAIQNMNEIIQSHRWYASLMSDYIDELEKMVEMEKEGGNRNRAIIEEQKLHEMENHLNC